MKKKLNKNLIMTEEEEKEQFQSNNMCWICENLIGNRKVRDHCHINEKYRGAAHWSCNINLQLTKIVSVTFHNLRGYNSHLIFCEPKKVNVKIDVTPNGLEKYTAFILYKNLVFIESVQFMNSSLEELVKNLSDNDFKYLTKEFGSKFLELLKQKGGYPYEYMDNFKRCSEEKLPDKSVFTAL